MKYWATVAAISSLVGVLVYCGKKTEIHQIGPDPVPTVECADGSRPGDFRELACEAGYEGKKLEVCSDRGNWELASDTCVKQACSDDGRDYVTFSEIKGILESRCVECHYTPENITNYAVASSWADEIYRRIRLPEDNIQFMPFQREPLDSEEVDLIRQWIDDGTPDDQECPDESAAVDRDYIESQALAYLNEIDQEDRPFIQFITAAHVYNLTGKTVEAFKAVDKTLNSLSFENELKNCQIIDKKKTTCAFDTRAFGLDINELRLIERADQANFISLSNKGRLLQDLTGRVQPIFHHDVWIDTTLGDPTVYYTLMRVPQYYDDFLEQFGINRLQRLADDDVTFAGFNGSPISIQKNRLIYRFDSERNGFDGACWSTADPIALNGDPTRNLFEFPFLDAVQSDKIFNFAAREVICHLPNNMFIYALFNAAGLRQDFAPTDIVFCSDLTHCEDPQIDNPIDCMGCHNAGYIPARDEVRDKALRSAAFNAEEKDRIRLIYKEQNELAAYFNRDNSQFSKALSEMNITLGDSDPVNNEFDKFRRDQTLAQVAAFLFVSKEYLIQCIEQSTDLEDEIGQLLEGARITSDQLLNSLPTIFAECNDVLNDRLGG